MAKIVRTPAQAKPFLLMTNQLNLWFDLARGKARMLRPVPDHHTAIRAHCGDNIRILRLVPSFIYFSRVVDLLYDVEFDFYGCLFRRSAAISADLSRLFVVVFDVGLCRIRQLDM